MTLGLSVTIVLSSRDGAKTLPRVLQSLKSGVTTDLEFILLDNDSSDQTLSILEDFARSQKKAIVIRNRPGISVNESFAKGVRLAKSPFVLLQADDDTWGAEYLDELLKLRTPDERPVLRFGHFRLLSDDGSCIADFDPARDLPIRTLKLLGGHGNRSDRCRLRALIYKAPRGSKLALTPQLFYALYPTELALEAVSQEHFADVHDRMIFAPVSFRIPWLFTSDATMLRRWSDIPWQDRRRDNTYRPALELLWPRQLRDLRELLRSKGLSHRERALVVTPIIFEHLTIRLTVSALRYVARRTRSARMHMSRE